MQNQIRKDDITFKEIFIKTSQWYSLLKSKWKKIIVFAVAGGALGFALSLISTPTYTAQLSFVLNSEKGKLGGYSGLAAQFGLNMGGAGGVYTEDDNIMALIRSRNMVVRTLVNSKDAQQHTLADRYLDFTGLRAKWKDNKTLANINFNNYTENTSRLHDSVLSFVYTMVSKANLGVAKPDTKTDIINITTVAKDEQFAKLFTERLLENVLTSYVDGQTKKAQENVVILNRQVDSVRAALNSAISGVAVSSDANPNMNPAFQRLRVPSQRRMVDVEMGKEILAELVKNLEVARVTLRHETPLVQVVDSPVLPLARTQLGRLKGFFIGFVAGSFFIILLITARAFIRALMASPA